MQESTVVIGTAAGAMETFIARPDLGGPPVILFMDVWGVREELLRIAREVAGAGYCCAVPDFYYRQGRIRTDFRDANNRVISVERLSEAQKEIVRAPLRRLTDRMVVEDTGAVIAQLDRLAGVQASRIGAVGYCMGGRHALRAAAAFAERFCAIASLHGTDLATDRSDSPHLDLRRMRGELYCGFAELDRFAAPETIAAVRAAAAGATLAYDDCVHSRAHHGYALPDRDVFDPQATEHDWARILAMFRRQLH